MKYIVIIFIFINFSCVNHENNPKSFIQKNQNENLSKLVYVNIEARGIREDTLRYYYSHTITGKETLTIPSFEFFDDFYKKDSSSYNAIFIKLCKMDTITNKSTLVCAKEYALMIDNIYKKLDVVNILSKPNMGKFIEFTLHGGSKVYYLEDENTLNPYWKDKFSKLKKVDEFWYYECR